MLVIGVVVCSVLGYGLVLDRQPGPVLTLADVSMPTPRAWTPLSIEDSAAIRNQITAILGTALVTDFRGAERSGQVAAGIARFTLSVDVTTESLTQILQSARRTTAGRVTVSRPTERLVGHRAAITAVMTTAAFSETMILIPEDKSIVLVIVGGDAGDATSDTRWILDHVTTTQGLSAVGGAGSALGR